MREEERGVMCDLFGELRLFTRIGSAILLIQWK